MPNPITAPTGLTEAQIARVIEELGKRTVRTLPRNWRVGRECPQCHSRTDRPNCMLGLGGFCPRNDPDNYDDVYAETLDALCVEASRVITALLDAVRASDTGECQICGACQFPTKPLRVCDGCVKRTREVEDAVRVRRTDARDAARYRWLREHLDLSLTEDGDLCTGMLLADADSPEDPDDDRTIWPDAPYLTGNEVRRLNTGFVSNPDAIDRAVDHEMARHAAPGGTA